MYITFALHYSTSVNICMGGDNTLPVKETNTRISVTIPKDIYNELLELAEYEDRSLSNLILMILKLYLKSRKRSKKG